MYTALHSLTDMVACTVTFKSKLAFIWFRVQQEMHQVLRKADSLLVVQESCSTEISEAAIFGFKLLIINH